MKWTRKKKPQAEESTLVTDSMLAIYVHDPGILLSDMPSGDRLRAIAVDCLARHDSAQTLSPRAYIRTVGTGGGLSMADQQVQALEDAPGVMKDLLQERGLNPRDYRYDVWVEDLSPKVATVWTAAIRKA